MLRYCFCFIFRVFGPEACGILAPQPGIKPVPPSLEGKVLTTGPPGKCPYLYFKPIQKLRVLEMKYLTLLVGSGARKQSHVSLTSPLYSLSAYFNNNITITVVLKCFELLGWTIALELQSGIMLQKSEWWWDSGYAGEPLHLILAERRRSSCWGPFKRPRLHGSGPASSSSLSSGGGCPRNSYQHRKGSVAPARHLTLPLSKRTQCPWNVPEVCAFRGFAPGNQIWAGHAWFHWSSHAMPSFCFLLFG